MSALYGEAGGSWSALGESKDLTVFGEGSKVLGTNVIPGWARQAGTVISSLRIAAGLTSNVTNKNLSTNVADYIVGGTGNGGGGK
jgi:hypothetical protein